jgi:hypothetical protein
MLLFGPLRSNEESCPYFGRVATLPATAPSAIIYIHSPAVVLFSSTITGSDKRIMISDVRQRRAAVGLPNNGQKGGSLEHSHLRAWFQWINKSEFRN